jgi:ABC-type Mn2+/Zn2+ transport system permease subunit
VNVTLLAFDPLEPFRYDFFARGLMVAVLTGALCGLVGVFVVLRSMSYIGHGLSHAVFGGAAISAIMGTSYFLGAGLWGVLAGLLIGRVAMRRSVGADVAIGVVTTASLAIGLAIQSRSGAVSRTLDSVLFGNVLGVFARDVAVVALVGLLVAAFVVGLSARADVHHLRSVRWRVSRASRSPGSTPCSWSLCRPPCSSRPE